ncbi:uncharacterized protein YdeI (YjbR/CyaY-like superfamily) [Neolewinella xylanilytica]|uniref:Uncharacterized protein YdeI (YjbR/CyaY-like superfamily) n=1 Tax=Neolewinella xylanilytica TaxID=1514080 RepID=A0A2S6I6W3_9BACT|nr:DUF1801 domain-containing protein [Neolewinella xylanilytica]PPK87246.1 uncharacterized protein YdeI (YjbR/CyaY-like superfamily) [Neolewinella xylanilytica]
MAKHPQVDDLLSRVERWRPELTALRTILLTTDLTETWKWRAPCYTYGGKNVAMLAGFKDSCALSFLKGALLTDPRGILEKPGENSVHVRLMRFTDITQVQERETVITAYLREAIGVEASGQQVEKVATPGEAWPAELHEKFAAVPGLEAAFVELTPGRQRGYLLYFNGAKQSASRTTRIERYQEKILSGKGFHDCHCGLSQRMPRCDGSHKALRV